MIDKDLIQRHNSKDLGAHIPELEYLSAKLQKKGVDVQALLKRIADFSIAIPSWALGTGGTRFGRFPVGGEPRTLEEKIEDVQLLHNLFPQSSRISLHIPWDIPEDAKAIKQQLAAYGLKIDSVNSNTFQDQKGQEHSYKFGSLSHTDKKVREQAIRHNLEVVEHGVNLGSKSLTIWLADGANFPGQQNLRKAFERTSDSINQIVKATPDDWTVLIEYKPYEPNFYSMVIPDWGTAYQLAQAAGKKAKVLVDLGHHLPNTNIEQIVARLMHFKSLGGFHFNGSMYGDDDLTTGAIKPYQLFLIFNELVEGMSELKHPEPAWMIDASHNTKDPLEDLIQSVEGILIAYAQALLVDRSKLQDAQERNEVALAQDILQDAFRTDVRPLIAEARKKTGGAIQPLKIFREEKIRQKLIKERGAVSVATGL